MAEGTATDRRPTRARVEYDIEIGLVQPPRVRDSIYPWDALREAAITQALVEVVEGEPAQLVSFFVPCDDEEHATASRVSIQTSGRTYYQKRRQNFIVSSSIAQEDDTWGVRSWVLEYPNYEDESTPQDEA